MFEQRIAAGHLTTHTAVLHNDFQTDEVLDRLGEEVQLRNVNFLRKASPFVLDNVESAVVHVARYAPTQGGTFRELPQFLALKHCIVNVKNEDNRCFGYSIIASRVPQDENRHRNRPTVYDKHFQSMGLDKLQYPVEPNQVPALEVTLKTNISLFSFYDDEGKARFPLYVSDKHYNRSVDLLYWQGHFALITNFERFLYDITRMRVKKWFCRSCFGHFMSEDALGRHHLFCNRPKFSNTIYTLPPPGTKIKFMNVRFQQRVPFVIYPDCEALCTPHDEKRGESQFYSHHVPCSIGYKLATDVPVLADEPYQSHTGPDVVDWFMRQMLDLQGRCMDYLFDYQRLVMTLNDERNFARAFECYICHRPFNQDKVRDHDHLTGKYRGAAHERCNLILRKTYKVPVLFHNFRGYDSNLIV